MARLAENFQLGDIVKDFDYDEYYIIIKMKPTGKFGMLYSLQDLNEPARVIGVSSLNMDILYKIMA